MTLYTSYGSRKTYLDMTYIQIVGGKKKVPCEFQIPLSLLMACSGFCSSSDLQYSELFRGNFPG